MPRQPFKTFADRNRGGLIDIGTKALAQRPEHFAPVGKCLLSWPHIEAELALVLGQLLGASNAAALAVFQTLRRSSAQRDAIREAAKIALNDTDQELLVAALNFHKAIEAERNAFAHGHMGISTKLDDGVLWLSTADYIAFKSIIVLVGDRAYTDEKRDMLNSSLYYYKMSDLGAIANDIELAGWVWSDMITYLQQQREQPRAELYQKLCNRPQIAQELALLRSRPEPDQPR